MHYDNGYVVVWDAIGPWDGKWRGVHYTDSARALIAPWDGMRAAINPDHPHAWLNLHAAPVVKQPMSRDTFDKLLRTYVGPGWTLSRLRTTCGAGWAKANLPPGAVAKAARILVAERCLAVPRARRRTNLLERTFVEVRRRTKIIGRFPGETSALSLIWAVLELSSRGWRGVTMTPKAVAHIERTRRGQVSPTDLLTTPERQEAVAA